MSQRNPDWMYGVVGNILRYGVLLSALVTVFGISLLVYQVGFQGVDTFLTYNSAQIPHGNYDVSLNGLLTGIVALKPFAIIDLGVIFLIGTPVSRVFASVFLFASERNTLYVYITAVVLAVLLFSIFVTPLIPGFQA